MSVGSATLLLAAIWVTIHVLHHFWTRKGTNSLLPTHLGAPVHPSRSTTQVSLNNLQLKVSTTKWNAYHDSLSNLLARRGKRNLSVLLQLVYNLGSILGAVGMLLAIGVVMWMCGNSAWVLLQKISLRNIGQHSDTPHFVKRMLENTVNSTPARATPSTRFSSITLIIPGVTVPLSDLPIIILAVFLSQVLHELGHATAAARESLPIIAAGLSFTVCIPAAFVTFPLSALKNLSPKARSRVIAAGPFHNLAFWCFLALVTHFKVTNIVSFVSGYQNISNAGKVVIDVSMDSPLSLHLSPGSIITKLDDKLLAFSDDLWTEYLTGPTEHLSLGWCVTRTLLEKSDACCTLINTKASPFSCFISQDHSERGCIDPVPLLTKPNGHGRCTSSGGCAPESACVIPHKESQLLRLTVCPSALQTNEETVVLWSGPRREVWEEVRVGNWLPRFWLLPLWFPPLLANFWEYLMMATLSLYVFNLLPLPYLDGTELLQSFLDLALDVNQDTSMYYDVEALEAGEEHQEGTRSRRRWKKGILKYIPILMSCLVLSCILFAVMNAIY